MSKTRKVGAPGAFTQHFPQMDPNDTAQCAALVHKYIHGGRDPFRGFVTFCAPLNAYLSPTSHAFKVHHIQSAMFGKITGV